MQLSLRGQGEGSSKPDLSRMRPPPNKLGVVAARHLASGVNAAYAGCRI